MYAFIQGWTLPLHRIGGPPSRAKFFSMGQPRAAATRSTLAVFLGMGEWLCVGLVIVHKPRMVCPTEHPRRE